MATAVKDHLTVRSCM